MSAPCPITAQRLREARRTKAFSQAQVARQCGVSEGTIRAWEHAKAEPGASFLKTLCRLYSVGADYLLGLSA